jgi:hypothetical protein
MTTPARPHPTTKAEHRLIKQAARVAAQNPFTQLSPKNETAYWDIREAREEQKPGVVRAFFDAAVAAAELAYRAGKGVSVPSIQSEDDRLPTKQLKELVETTRFREALRNRGIPLPDQTALEPKQVALLAILADQSVIMSEREKCALLDIPYERFLGWLEWPAFRIKYQGTYEKALKRATEQGDAQLAALINQGNLNAIKYANEMTGKYRPQDAQAMSVVYILNMVLSILQKHLTDEVMLTQVSGELMSLATGNGLPAPMVLESTAPVPAAHEDIQDAEVVEATPEVVEDDLPSVLRGFRGNTDHPVPSSDGGDSGF